MKHTIIKSLLVTTSLTPFISFTITSCAKKDKDVVILFTNDTHCTLENADTGLGWVQLKGYRDWLETRNCDTLLVDAGDFAQGGVYGTLSKGQYITSLMNACQYDLTIPGNHEFDYGMARFNEIVNELHCPMISANFYNYDHETDKPTTPVLSPTAILKAGGKKIGFIGISTPQTMTSSNPSNFKDDKGNFIYSFLGTTEATPTLFYSTIQSSIDSLKQQGVDYVIGLTHLGIGIVGEYSKYGSKQLIANTSGFDVIIDGHSHTYQPAIKIKDKKNNDVYLTQTGTGFDSIGQMIIHDDKLSFALVDGITTESKEVQEVVDNIKKESDEILSKKIGTAPFTLTTKGADGKRAVRNKECNMGDFFADAVLHSVGDVDNDIAIYNGGSIRADLTEGDLTYGDFLTTAPFANAWGKLKISGQVLLDALEYSVSKLSKDDPSAEFGGFLQLGKNLQMNVDLSIDSPVVLDENGAFDHIPPGATRRVTATYKSNPISTGLDYNVVASTYTLFDLGDGFNMFKDCEQLECKQIIDADGLIEYFEYLLKHPSELNAYSNPLGQGRITYI